MTREPSDAMAVDLSPGVDAPSPAAVRERIASGADASADIERDLRRLAERAGGWASLRALLDHLAAGER